MDAEKFGAFIASVRKEKGMTQADLAKALQVTDKAVSRWERGLGFPDIHSLEPLARALDISLVELMQSERSPGETVTTEVASQALVHTVDMAKREQRRRGLRRWAVAGGILLVAVALFWVFAGLCVRTDVAITEYAVLPSGSVMTVRAGVAGSMGYIRDCRDISDDPQRAVLRFYSAFGGLNSSFGAQSVYLIPLAPECTQIYVDRGSERILVLEKNEATGQWEWVEK